MHILAECLDVPVSLWPYITLYARVSATQDPHHEGLDKAGNESGLTVTV